MGRLAEPGDSRALFRRAPADPGGIADVSIKVDGAVEKSVKERISELIRDNLTLKREIAARDSAERELKRTINELERSNRELQEFAFVASHDLQAPLRKMQAFASLLDEEYGSALDEEARGYIRLHEGLRGKDAQSYQPTP